MKSVNMKNLIKLSIFVMILVLMFTYISFLFRPEYFFKKNIRGYYAEKNNTIDVVLIGGSSTYFYWTPMVAYEDYGIASYNFAGDAMSPALIKNSIVEVEKSQNPRLLIIDVRAFINRENIPDYYTEAYIRYYTDSLNYSRNRINMISYACDSEDITVNKTFYFDIMKYHSRWKELTVTSFENSFNRKRDPYKGFCFMYQYQPIDMNDFSDIAGTEKLTSENDRILTELLNYCKKNNYNCLFTVNPYKLENERAERLYNYIEHRVKEYGFNFVNSNKYYDDLSIDFSNDFYDVNHVNIYGAIKYTDFLADFIINNYSIPDRRSDESYDLWDSDCEIWHQSSDYCKLIIDRIKDEYKKPDNLVE